MNCKRKAVIFDLDGTLLDTLSDLADSVNCAMGHFSYPTHSKKAVCSFVGNGVGVLIEHALPDGRLNPDFDKCLAFFKEHYARHMYDTTKEYNGITEALIKLRSMGYLIGVVSNKFDLAVKELCKRYFSTYIDVAIGECEEKGIKKKPAPDTVKAALDALDVTSENAVYIGDSEVDIETAKNASMSVISVLWGFRSKQILEESGASVFADSTEEMLREIEKILG